MVKVIEENQSRWEPTSWFWTLQDLGIQRDIENAGITKWQTSCCQKDGQGHSKDRGKRIQYASSFQCSSTVFRRERQWTWFQVGNSLLYKTYIIISYLIFKKGILLLSCVLDPLINCFYRNIAVTSQTRKRWFHWLKDWLTSIPRILFTELLSQRTSSFLLPLTLKALLWNGAISDWENRPKIWKPLMPFSKWVYADGFDQRIKVSKAISGRRLASCSTSSQADRILSSNQISTLRQTYQV